MRFDAFPEVRVCIEKKSYPGSNFSLHHYGKQLPAHTAEFQIYEPLNFSTLARILDYPFDCHVSGKHARTRIRGISRAVVWVETTFYPSDNGSRNLFRPTECSPRCAFVARDYDNVAKEPGRTETPIRAVSQLAMRLIPKGRKSNIQRNNQKQLESWTRQVSPRVLPVIASLIFPSQLSAWLKRGP